ncbi:uncharacterized protein [Ptychodera flava]|uniref:uncharacterized protein n=1 Tax=Ptychodera flava TaxID=63121 RepID=UPI003969D4D9
MYSPKFTTPSANKLSPPKQSNVSDNNAVGALSESLLTLRLEFTSPGKFLNTGKIETDAEMLVKYLYRNATNSLEILEFEMLPSSFSTRVVLLKYSVFVDSVTLAKVLRETCLDSWQKHVYYFLPQDVTALDVSFKQTWSNLCNDSKEEIILNTTILFHKSETNSLSSLSNITKQSPDHLQQLNYRACHYEQVGGGIVSIKSTIGACLRHDSNISCTKGVIIKVGKENFEMIGEDIVYRSMHYLPQEYLLSEEGLHAFLCHFDKKRVFFWDLNTKTYSKKLLTFTTSVLSIGCFLATIIVTVVLKEIRQRAGKIILNLAIALLIAHVLFITVVDLPQFKTLCKAAAIVSHYIWLVAFCWMAVASFDLAYISKQLTVNHNDRLIWIYCSFAWVLPLVLVTGCVLIDIIGPYEFKIGYSEGPVCWIGRSTPLMAVFVVPVALILVFNVICFIITVTIMCKSEVEMKKHRSKSFTTRNVVFAVQITTIMGLTWSLNLVDSFTQSDWLDYVYIILNGLQGLSIFVSFLLRRRTFQLLRETCFKCAKN